MTFGTLNLPHSTVSMFPWGLTHNLKRTGALQLYLGLACLLGICGECCSLPISLPFPSSSMWLNCFKTRGSLLYAPAQQWRSRRCCLPCSLGFSASKAFLLRMFCGSSVSSSQLTSSDSDTLRLGSRSSNLHLETEPAAVLCAPSKISAPETSAPTTSTPWTHASLRLASSFS